MEALSRRLEAHAAGQDESNFVDDVIRLANATPVKLEGHCMLESDRRTASERVMASPDSARTNSWVSGIGRGGTSS
jgi:hypothetical protein